MSYKVASFYLLIFALFAVVRAAPNAAALRTFTLENDRFVLDGKNISIKSGSVHYSRVPFAYWDDRLARLRAMGANTVMTYVPWNWHETKKGTFDFRSEGRDLARFIQLAQKHDLLVILRAGPYMCGEWEFGGLPAWLLENGTIALRTDAEPYVSLALTYWEEGLFPIVKPLLLSNGGNIVMVQVENEFGSYGNVDQNPADKSYLQKLIVTARKSLGDDVILYVIVLVRLAS